jgi:DNA polymerase I
VKEKDVGAVRGFRTEKTNLKNFRGDSVVKVVAKKPEDIGKLNSILQKKGIITYEADIPYIRRWMIDKDVHIKKDMTKIYFDFETESYLTKEVKDWRLKSVALVDYEGKEFYFASDNERQIINYFLNIISGYDLVIGWNSDMFDLVVLESAMEREKMSYWDLKKKNTFFDLLEGYKRDVAPSKKGLHNFSLDNIAQIELGKSKKELSMGIKTKAFKDMTKEEKEKLREYNLEDARLVKEIDEKTGESEIRINLASEGYVFVDETFSITRLIDSILLKRFRDAGYVLPSVRKSVKEGDVKGAFIKESKKGLFHNVVVYDVTSLYPSVIMNYRISPEPERRVIPSFLAEIFNKRKEEKEKYEKTKEMRHKYLQYALKILMNATYGYLGTSSSRLYDVKLVGSVTGYGRIVIGKMIKYFEGKGLEVVFGDTDSCAVVLPDKDVKNVSETHRLGVVQYLKSELGKEFEVKVDKLYKKLYLTGVKKRYVGMLDNGEREVTGFELIRGDWFELAKEVEAKCFDIIFEYEDEDLIKEKVKDMLDEVTKNLFAGKYDSKLVFSISKFRKEAKVKTRTIRVLEELKKRNIKLQNGSNVEYIVGKKGSVIPVLDGKPLFEGKPDYDFYMRRIVDLVERVVGIKYNWEFQKVKKLTSFA